MVANFNFYFYYIYGGEGIIFHADHKWFFFGLFSEFANWNKNRHMNVYMINIK